MWTNVYVKEFMQYVSRAINKSCKTTKFLIFKKKKNSVFSFRMFKFEILKTQFEWVQLHTLHLKDNKALT